MSTSFLAGAGIVGISIPFIQSWSPSAKARASGAPVKVNISKIEVGGMITVEWQGKPVWILRRTQKHINQLSLKDHRENLLDPDSSANQQPDFAKNEYRSIRPEILVAVGICTHLGCVPAYKKAEDKRSAEALYFCACHGSKFDLAGRVFKGVPAPSNLIIPPHHYVNNDLLEIGVTTRSG